MEKNLNKIEKEIKQLNERGLILQGRIKEFVQTINNIFKEDKQ